MKTKVFSILLALSLLSTISFAQKSQTQSGAPFVKGTKIINIGIVAPFGAGYPLYSKNAESALTYPKFVFAYEVGVTKKLGIGYIGVGGESSLFDVMTQEQFPSNWDYQGYGAAVLSNQFRAFYHLIFTL
ncbi:MAG: hypothetical protein IPO21_13120 [Bacteroidales bacterium]|nr:hypothetical protein [Bacteroidales bacterium]